MIVADFRVIKKLWLNYDFLGQKYVFCLNPPNVWPVILDYSSRADGKDGNEVFVVMENDVDVHDH